MAKRNNSHEDEILFKDETGQLKILSGQKIQEISQEKELSRREELTKTGASFSFDEDDKEINGFRRNIPTSPLTQLNFDRIVDEVVKKSHLRLKDESLKKRFTNIVLLRLKDVRDKLETRSMLMRPESLGGLGLKIGKADAVSGLIEKKLQSLTEKIQVLVEESDEKEMLEKTKVRSPVEPKKPTLIFKETKSEPPVRKEPDEERLKFKTKLVGPIEELENLNLTDFRRLAKNPREACDKIFDKIRLLKEESFIHEVKAIKAWQKSPLNQLYLEEGEQSLQEGINLETVIAKRKEAGQSYLSIDEFKAIMDFNKKLRY